MANSIILKELIEKLGVSVSQFERDINVGSSAINKAIERNSRIKSDTIAKIISTYPQVNEKWLETGEGDMFTSLIKPEKDTMQLLIEALYGQIEALKSTLKSNEITIHNQQETIKVQKGYIDIAKGQINHLIVELDQERTGRQKEESPGKEPGAGTAK